MLKLMRQLLKIWKTMGRVGGPKMILAFLRTAPQQIALFKRLIVDPRVPPAAKALLFGAAGFAISPLNIPNWIPILGPLDDLGVFLLAFSLFMRFVPNDVLSEHRRAVGLTEPETAG
jgi:uncharacterized membrane protein YkvA (DUF1232 family)